MIEACTGAFELVRSMLGYCDGTAVSVAIWTLETGRRARSFGHCVEKHNQDNDKQP